MSEEANSGQHSALSDQRIADSEPCACTCRQDGKESCDCAIAFIGNAAEAQRLIALGDLRSTSVIDVADYLYRTTSQLSDYSTAKL